MRGKVTEILDGRSDGFKLVTIRKDGYDTRAFVREEFKIAVGDTAEFDVDDDGDAHITDVKERRT